MKYTVITQEKLTRSCVDLLNCEEVRSLGQPRLLHGLPSREPKDIKYLLICATSGSHEDHRVHRESIQIEVINIACKHNTRLATTKNLISVLRFDLVKGRIVKQKRAVKIFMEPGFWCINRPSFERTFFQSLVSKSVSIHLPR